MMNSPNKSSKQPIFAKSGPSRGRYQEQTLRLANQFEKLVDTFIENHDKFDPVHLEAMMHRCICTSFIFKIVEGDLHHNDDTGATRLYNSAGRLKEKFHSMTVNDSYDVSNIIDRLRLMFDIIDIEVLMYNLVYDNILETISLKL